MATSGVSTFSTSAEQLIKGALRIVGAISQGEEPTQDMFDEAIVPLNMVAKQLMTDGMPLWAIHTYVWDSIDSNIPDNSITIGESSEAIITETPKPLKILQAYTTNIATGNDTPIRIVTQQEYNMLGNKNSTGGIIQIYNHPLVDYSRLYYYPVPDTTWAEQNTLTIIYQRPFYDFVLGDWECGTIGGGGEEEGEGYEVCTYVPAYTIDFPQEWYNALKWALADSLTNEYGLSIEDRRDIEAKAKRHHDAALSFGTEEGSLYLTADKRKW